MVKEPAGGCRIAIVDPASQVPAVIDPVAAIVMGQAIPPPITACHVPTIIDWEQTGSFGSAAKAVEEASTASMVLTITVVFIGLSVLPGHRRFVFAELG
jgi:hypothetical protein